jgi:2-methylcitrate dehydratase PrpD
MALKHESYQDGATRDLASFAAKLRYEDLPAHVVAHAKHCLLDSLGCGLFGATLPWTRMVADMVIEDGAQPKSTIYGQAKRTSPANAALVNSTACHAYELDDIHKLAMFHPGSIAVPVALALAQAQGGVDGRSLVTAMVAGYEVSLRIGMAAGMPLFFRGYHPQATIGTFTGAATAARLLNLDAEQTLHALGIGGTQAAGLMAAQEGSMVKRFHSGRAAQSGVYAGLLARKGFTGIVDIVEAGYGGFLSTLSGEPKPEYLTAGLGSRWELPNVGFKPYACVTSIHSSLDGLRELMQQHSLKADDIEKLDVGLSPMTHVHCAWEYKAQGVTAAQMNLYFGLGAVAVDGDAFVAQYKESRVADPAILRFIQKIDAHVDPEIEKLGAKGRHAMRMKIITRDGRTFGTFIEHRRGSPENALTWDEMERKFRLLCHECIDEGRTNRIVELVKDVEKLSSIEELCTLMAFGS